MTEAVMKYILDNYGAEPEYPFITSPDTAIFRNSRNGKWFAVLLGKLAARCMMSSCSWASRAAIIISKSSM